MRNFSFNKPRFRECFTVEIIQPRTVFVLNEHRHFVFEGEIYPAIAPLLDGQHGFGELMGALANRFSWGDLFAAFHRLIGSQVLVDADGSPLPEHAAFWDGLSTGTEAQQSIKRLAETTLAVRTVAGLNAESMERALKQSDLRVEADGDLLVVVTDDYLRDELAEIDRQARELGRSWMLVKPVGTVVWAGPLFRPGKTACWHCLEHRLRANRQVERYIRSKSKAAITLSKSRRASMERAGASFAAVELAKALSSDTAAPIETRIYTLDLLSYAMEEHTLVRRSQCQACGQPVAIAAPRPIELTSHRKRPRFVAGERTAEPEEIFRKYQYHISPVTGAVASFVPRDLESNGVMHNYVAGHYFPIFSDDMTTLQVNQLARSGGKGSTESQAKAGALAESLERYSGICWGDEHSVKGSFNSLQPEAVRVGDVLLFSEKQYKNHKEWNAQPANQRHYVPDPLADTAEVSWSPLWSLTHRRTRYLPSAFCWYGHLDHGLSFCRCDSNGCAAGNTIEEAIVQGFLELAERDAVAMWWYNRLHRPAVDVSSFDLPYWDRMREYYARDLKRDLHVIDITNDLTVPTFVAISRRLDQPKEDILIGIGAHLEPRSALMQALVEANQSVPLLHYLSKTGSRLERFFPKDVLDWLAVATYENQQYLVPDEAATPRKYADFRKQVADDVRDDVLTCVEIAKACGLEVLVLDQTRPDIGMPVVRVVVPGLTHFWRRLAPGRLYDVPVRMGWLDKPRTEEEINPISFFI